MTNEEKIEAINKYSCEFDKCADDSLFLLFKGFNDWNKLPKILINRLYELAINGYIKD